MTDRELMQQALEALEMWCKGPHDSATRRGKNTRSSVAIAALRERLAQPEPAPGYCQHCKQYTIEEPMRREWVGLTDEECIAAIDEDFNFALDHGNVSDRSVIRYARAIEAKLREKNS